MHCCLNVVCGERDSGTAVLLRAGEALEGERRMLRLRGLPPRPGPGRPRRRARPVCAPRSTSTARSTARRSIAGLLRVAAGDPVADGAVATGPRVGVSYAGEAARWPLRFAIAGHPEVSRPRLVTAASG